jgi:hypothetical protein
MFFSKWKKGGKKRKKQMKEKKKEKIEHCHKVRAPTFP